MSLKFRGDLRCTSHDKTLGTVGVNKSESRKRKIENREACLQQARQIDTVIHRICNIYVFNIETKIHIQANSIKTVFYGTKFI